MFHLVSLGLSQVQTPVTWCQGWLVAQIFDLTSKALRERKMHQGRNQRTRLCAIMRPDFLSVPIGARSAKAQVQRHTERPADDLPDGGVEGFLQGQRHQLHAHHPQLGGQVLRLRAGLAVSGRVSSP